MSQPLDRRTFLHVVGAGAAAMALPPPLLSASQGSAGRKPNILVIVADDLGYGDLGVQGCRDVPTPNIDAIAKNGARFTNGYVSCPVCSPTRAGLMTGRYQQRFGHEFNPGPQEAADSSFGLPLTEVTLADRLKAAGYATGLVGKWHLGFKPEFHPQKRGFDEFFGFLGGAHPYFGRKAGRRNPILRGTKPVIEEAYLTDAFAREGVAFIDRHKGGPFLLMLTFNAIHTPQQASPKYLDGFRDIKDPIRQRMAAMLSALDEGVGAVMKKLRESALEHDTLVFFISDNGGPTPSNGSRNGELSGYKAQVREGGIRVPFLLQWVGHVPPGSVYDLPVISLDIHPTCLAAAGVNASIPAEKALDGVNLVPFVNGSRSGAPHDALFWRMGPQAAVRAGRHKLVRTQKSEQLFDLDADVGEKMDLAKQKPEVLKDLKARLAAWEAQMKAPAWTRRQRRRRRTQHYT